jgi:hypothetical protein
MKNTFAASGSSPTRSEPSLQPPADILIENHGSISLDSRHQCGVCLVHEHAPHKCQSSSAPDEATGVGIQANRQFRRGVDSACDRHGVRREEVKKQTGRQAVRAARRP